MPSLIFNPPVLNEKVSTHKHVMIAPEIPLAKGGISASLILPPKPSLIRMMPDIKLPPMPLPPQPK
jgi:hypothetical protein